MVASAAGKAWSVLMIVLYRNTMKGTSAARNEGSDEPLMVPIKRAVAGLAAATIVDALRSTTSDAATALC